MRFLSALGFTLMALAAVIAIVGFALFFYSGLVDNPNIFFPGIGLIVSLRSVGFALIFLQAVLGLIVVILRRISNPKREDRDQKSLKI